jgi:hypothetical protein
MHCDNLDVYPTRIDGICADRQVFGHGPHRTSGVGRRCPIMTGLGSTAATVFDGS